jgi:spore maturation protein CgeB
VPQPLDIVVLGLSITSSWGNGHATTFRGLVRALDAAGHRVLFLERDKPWYAENRDLPEPSYGATRLYDSLDELKDTYADDVRRADLVVVGSYVPDGVAVGDWVQATAGGVTAFYDIDTPVTLAKLARGDDEYLAPRQIPGYDLYLSFTGGPTLDRLERAFGSPAARPLYCQFDPEAYAPDPDAALTHDLGYMGTYSDDRQPGLERLLLKPARQWAGGRFVVVAWPANCERIGHLPPARHRAFYTSQRFTLNLTRADMVAAGYAPSVRLFEAAACATPIVSDWWEGLDTFFVPGEEILIARSSDEALGYLRSTPDDERLAIGERARQRVLAEHTAAHRAEELVAYVAEAASERARAAA